jgi:hypothetical protein
MGDAPEISSTAAITNASRSQLQPDQLYDNQERSQFYREVKRYNGTFFAFTETTHFMEERIMKNTLRTTFDIKNVKKDLLQGKLSIRDMSTELKKREARKPLYIDRYE